jgi:Glycosyltransferase Family 4
MIKVAHLIIGLNTGGAERALYRLVAGMDRSRFENVVASLTDKGPMARPIEDAGVRVQALGANLGLGGVGLPFRLVSLLRRERPAILQTWLYHADYIGLYAA